MKERIKKIIQRSAIVVAVGVVGFAGGLTATFVGGGNETVTINPGGGQSDAVEHIPAASLFSQSEEWDESGTPVALTEDSASMVARSFQEQFRKVSAATLPVVVEINVVNKVTRRVQPNPFEFFFGPERGRERGTEPEEREFSMRGMGSGVIIGRDGDTVYVLTNNHVAGEADEIEIGLYDGRTFEAELVGGDELIDLAMLSFETDEEVPIATLGNSSSLQPGDWVFAVGNPLGFESTITAGIVSATSRAAGAQSGMSGITDYIQTDAAINRGNSGGPLVNIEGEVVGINTWIASNSGGSIGIGFAIPVNNARRAIEDFIQSGEVSYSWLGVQVSTLTPDYAEEMGLDTTEGAFVTAVYGNSPAAQSGIEAGDTIVSVDGKKIRDSNELVRNIANLTPGQSVPFVIIRDGRRISITVRTGRRNEEATTSTDVWPGMSVAPISDDVREQLELNRRVRGVIVSSVQAQSQAQQSGLRRGDILTAINGEEVSSVREFYNILADVEDEEVQFRVLRNGQQLILGFVRPTE